jgi:hypothetical protein
MRHCTFDMYTIPSVQGMIGIKKPHEIALNTSYCFLPTNAYYLSMSSSDL